MNVPVPTPQNEPKDVHPPKYTYGGAPGSPGRARGSGKAGHDGKMV